MLLQTRKKEGENYTEENTEFINFLSELQPMFTIEELKALYKIVEYAAKDLTIEDEPLLDSIIEKLEQYA